MKKIALLSLLLVLCLTACEEKEPDKDNQVVENTDNSETGDKGDDIEDNKDENSDIIVEDVSDGENSSQKDDETEQHPVATPVFTDVDKSVVYCVENGELKEPEYTLFSTIFALNGRDFPIDFRWCTLVDGQFYMSRVQSDAPKPDVWYDWFFQKGGLDSNRRIFCIYAEDKMHYRILDLSTGSIEMFGDSAFWDTTEVNNVFLSEDGTKAIVLATDEIYYYDGNAMNPIKERLALAGMQVSDCGSLYARFVDGAIIFSCENKNSQDERLLSCYTYDAATDEVTCTVSQLKLDVVTEYQDAWKYDGLFATYRKGGYLTILNLLTGQERVTQLSSEGEIHFYQEKYFIVESGDAFLTAIDAYNGRIVGELQCPKGTDYFDIQFVSADEGIYFKIISDEVAIYRMEVR